MIAAPLATVDVGVDLPTSNAERQPRPDQPIFLIIKSDVTLWLGDAPVSSTVLRAALDGISKGDRTPQRVFLRADKSVSYGNLMEKMNSLRTAGYLKVASWDWIHGEAVAEVLLHKGRPDASRDIAMWYICHAVVSLLMHMARGCLQLLMNTHYIVYYII
jgi:biopolymer transport protein ExbD